jgi:hypothetical protein
VQVQLQLAAANETIHKAAMDHAANQRAIVVSAADAKFYELVTEMIESVRRFFLPNDLAIGCLDVGLTADQAASLRNHGVQVVDPNLQLTFADQAPSLREMAFLARPCLPNFFDGYYTYIWIDADAWIQTKHSIDELISAANRSGAAFVREDAPSYKRKALVLLWMAKRYFLGFGVLGLLELLPRSQINAGVYAIRHDSELWKNWAIRYKTAMRRTGQATPYDQFALNAAVYLDDTPCEFLPATFNWTCHLSLPKVDSERGGFCTPDDGRTIHVIHLTSGSKTSEVEIEATNGTVVRGRLRFGATLTRVHGATGG